MAKLVIGENDLETWCKNNNREDLLIEWDYFYTQSYYAEVKY